MCWRPRQVPLPSADSRPLPHLVSEPSRIGEDRPGRGTRAGALRWSWRIGTLAGIPVHVHVTFVMLLAWIALSHLMRGQGARAIASGVGLTLSIFACVVLHELSHALVARHFGIGTKSITLLPIGGVANLERMPEKPRQELVVALAGPAMNFAIAGGLFGLLAFLGGPVVLQSLHVVGGPFLTKLMWINVGLAAFNLLPAFPMDGGRVLRAALALRLDRGRATDVAARIGQGMALLFAVVGLFANPFLLLIAAFVWIGAKGEASLVQLQSALRGLTVSQAMITDFRVLAPGEPLARAVQVTLAGFQQDFPVMDGDRLAGLLTHADVLKGLAERGPEAAVATAMQREVEIAAPSEMLDAALARLQRREGRALIVVQEGHVVGLLTPENLGEMLTMAKAVSASRARPA
jgi:Zn-dependent protease/CBS domain-containing protein